MPIDTTIAEIAATNIALGQVFMRKYGMYISYLDDGSVEYRIAKGEEIPSSLFHIISFSVIICGLTFFVVYLTFRKIKRIKSTNDLY